MKRVSWRAFALAAAISLTTASSVYAQADRYQKSYFQAGFMLRAFRVCKNEAILNSLPIGGTEYRMFSQAYPNTIKAWMFKGAEGFNRLVMQGGIGPACRYAQGLTR